MTKPIQLY